MNKKIIQVPVDEELLSHLDELSEIEFKSRSEIIRQACRSYIEKVETERLDTIYQAGYERIPEDTKVTEAQVDLAGEILSEESW